MPIASSNSYILMVNRVLSACNQPEIPTAQWTQARLEARKVKRIVAECHRDMMNQMPDDYFHRQYEFTLWAPVADGMVTDITTNVVTGDTDFDAAVVSMLGNLYPAGCYFRLTSETDWYQVDSFDAGPPRVINLASNHLNPGTWVDGVGYQVVQYRYPLSSVSDFRDIVDVSRPFAGMDMKPTSVQTIRKMWAEAATAVTAVAPTHYALGSLGAVAGGESTAERMLYLYPIIAEDHRAELLYQKLPTFLDYENDTYGQGLDLPEDMLDRLLYRAKMIARLEILGDSAGAGLYRSLEKEKQRDDASKEASQAGMNQLQPDVGAYRGHYQGARNSWGGRLWRRS